jgi:alpha-1,3-rhamnosyltransferase
MKHEFEPLVSVIVIAYNSGEFIAETLDSIRNQNYRNIELIVADDCSRDDTSAVCRDWMERNRSRFNDVKLMVGEKNRGIAGNCNAGMNSAKGELVKLIAGDDLLEQDCISEFVNFFRDNKDVDFACCGMTPFGKASRYKMYYPPQQYFNRSAKGQLKMLLRRGTMIPGPAMFFRREVYENVGGFNEEFPFVEDYPYFIKLARSGCRCYLLKKPLVRYRVHEKSITQTGSSKFDESIKKCHNEFVLPLIREERLYLFAWHYWLEAYVNDRRDSNGIFRHLAVRRIIKLIDPVGILEMIYKLFGKSYPYRAVFDKIDADA